MLGHLKQRIFVWQHRKDITDLHRVFWIYTFIFLVWGVYRLLFPVHVWLEETLLKFIVFGLPTFWVVFHHEKGRLEDLGMTTQGLVISFYFGLLFGLWLAVFGNVVSLISTGHVGFNPELRILEFRDLMILGLFTAFWEQLFFSGYMLPRLLADFKDETVSIVLTAFLFALIHMPVQLASGVGGAQILIRFILIFTLQFGNGVLYIRFKNLAAPIFAHLAWGSVIYLFG